ncbi:hypothetical protein JCM11251_007096 [Rhodosporidiobolus azoricus]
MSSTAVEAYTKEDLLDRSPFLLKLSRKRLAPSRLNELLSAARNKQPPQEPDPTECCGSSCKPCVRELWREEKRVWEEVHPDSVEEEEAEEEEGKKVGERGGGGPRVEIGLEKVEVANDIEEERNKPKLI